MLRISFKGENITEEDKEVNAKKYREFSKLHKKIIRNQESGIYDEHLTIELGRLGEPIKADYSSYELLVEESNFECRTINGVATLRVRGLDNKFDIFRSILENININKV